MVELHRSPHPSCPIKEDKLAQKIWGDAALDKALSALEQPCSTQAKQQSPFAWVTAMAACTLLVITLGMLWPIAQQPQVSTPVTVQVFKTDKAEQHQHILADGSSINLNANTSLNIAFTEEKRLVTFTQGEAYFNVAPNKQRPFKINTPHGAIQVVGTAFNIDQDDKSVEIKVYEGVVKVSNASGQHLYITQGQKVFLSTRGALSKVDTFNSTLPEDWMLGMLQANNMTLEQIISRLNRYSTNVISLDTKLNNKKVTSSFTLSNISQSVLLLAELYDLALLESEEGLYLTSK
jgi:transmembrane sensor